MEQKIFNHLHLHTEYSFRDAISHIKDVVDKAIDIGSSAVAVTDHGGMHATIELYKECLKRNKKFEENGDSKRINPILGCELYVIENKDLLLNEETKHDKKHIVFLAKDITGYHQIADSVTRGQMLKDKDTYPRVTHDDIKEIFVGGHVVCLSACVNGEIPTWIRKGNMEKAKEVALFYKSVFGDDFYLELQDHNLMMELEYIGGLVQLSKELDIPLVATNDCHYIEKEDYKVREMVLAMRWGKTIDEIEPDCQELYMKNSTEMCKLFKDFPDAINNTIKISEKCHVDGLLVEGEITLKEDENYDFYMTNIPDGIQYENLQSDIVKYLTGLGINKTNYTIEDKSDKYYKKFLLSIKKDTIVNKDTIQKIKDELNKMVHIKHFPKFKVPSGFKDEKEYITHLAYAALPQKYPTNVFSKEYLDTVKERVEYELGVICDLHYEGYLLIVSDFINKGKTFGLIGPGRGSAVGSIICYLIGITSVDPLPYNLIFERFLNKDRVSDPDIDTDFAPNIRDLVIDYVKEVYGDDAVCQIVTYGTLAAKAAIRAIGRIYNIDKIECDKVAKMIPNEPNMTLKKALEDNPEIKNEMLANKDAQFLIDNAFKLEGLIVQTGVHAAGVIIADRNVSAYCPLSYDTKKQIWITQTAKDSCEHDFGLLKMDFLGLENLRIIDGTFADIKKNYGIELTLDSISLTNKEEMTEVILNIFAKGRTKGVFQFESEGMVKYLKKLKPKTLEDLILLNAAYRPGPMQYIDTIIEIKNGTKSATYLCEEMKDILGVTFSKPIYQEQIQQIFHRVAGFSLGVADIIRRAMSKKKLKELEKYLPPFKDKLAKKGVLESDSQAFCDELIDFAKYAFNKSHAAAYSVVAYQTAWLKYYYPVEYMANLLNSSTTKTMPIYINECKRMEIKVLPPNINLSGMNFTPTKDNSILFGLKVKNTGVSGLDIIDEREKNGLFKDITDFSNRMKLRKSRCMYANVIDSYVLSGALYCFGKTRRTMNEGMTAYVKEMNRMIELETRQKERMEEITRLKEITNRIYPIYSFICSESGLYEYAKNMKKAMDNYENAKAENDVNGMESADFEMQNSFPSMFISMYGLDEQELRKNLYDYAIAYGSLQKKENNTNNEEQISITKLSLEQVLSHNLPEYDILEILDKEKELLGFYASGHPLDGYRSMIEDTASCWIGDLSEENDNKREKLVGRISNFKLLYRKSDKRPMCKFTLEGLTGDIDCICFTKAYGEYGDIFNEHAIVTITGIVRADVEYDEYGEISQVNLEMQVEKADTIKTKQNIYIRVDDMFQFNHIRPLIDTKCGGNNSLYVYFSDTKKCLKYNNGVANYELVRQILPPIIDVEFREHK